MVSSLSAAAQLLLVPGDFLLPVWPVLCLKVLNFSSFLVVFFYLYGQFFVCRCLTSCRSWWSSSTCMASSLFPGAQLLVVPGVFFLPVWPVLCLQVLNFSSFLVIFFSYLWMFFIAKQTRSAVRSNESKNDAAMARRMTLIVMTDFLCWVPIILLGFASLGGARSSNEVSVCVCVCVWVVCDLTSIHLDRYLNADLYSNVVVLSSDRCAPDLYSNVVVLSSDRCAPDLYSNVVVLSSDRCTPGSLSSSCPSTRPSTPFCTPFLRRPFWATCASAQAASGSRSLLPSPWRTRNTATSVSPGHCSFSSGLLTVVFLSCLVLSCLVLQCLVLSCFDLSYPVLSYPVLSLPLSYPVLPALSCHILPCLCLALSCLALS